MKNKDGKEITLEDLEKAIFGTDHIDGLLENILKTLEENGITVKDADINEGEKETEFILEIEDFDEALKVFKVIPENFKHSKIECHSCKTKSFISIKLPKDTPTPEEKEEHELPDWQERLLEEYQELRERFNKLNAFIGTDKFKGMSRLERKMLCDQHDPMLEYLEILEYRLDFYHIEH